MSQTIVKAEVIIVAATPTSGGGVQAPLYKLLINTADSSWWYKSGEANTAWTKLVDGVVPVVKYSPPEKWISNNVALSQTNLALETLVSENFANIAMIIAGSIIGMGWRWSSTVTAGTATIKPTKNGAAVANLSGVSTNASNQNGGQSTQAAGLDTFVAGDTLGFQITTDGSFAPSGTTNVEAWLLIATT